MKKIITIISAIISGSIIGAFIAYAAVTIPVPLAPGANYVLLSTTTGYYAAVATSSLGISGGSGGSSGLGTTTPYLAGFLPYATSTGNLTNSVIFESGNNITIGTTSPVTLLTVVGSTTISSLGAGSVFSTSGGGLYVVTNTGTGLNVLQTSPTLVTPILGVASGTALTLSNNEWLTNLAQTGGTVLAVNPQGLIVATTTVSTFVASGTALTLSGNLWVSGATSLQGLSFTNASGTAESLSASQSLWAAGAVNANNFNSTGSSIPANGFTESAANVLTFYTNSNPGLSIGSTGSTTINDLVAGPVLSAAGGGLYNASTTGSGNIVEATSPTLVTPILGNASGTALTLTNNLWENANIVLSKPNSLLSSGWVYTFGLSASTTVGDIVFLDSTQHWSDATAVSSTTASSTSELGLALNTATGGNVVAVLRQGLFFNPSWNMGTGTQQFLASTTPGQITNNAPTAQGNCMRVVGYMVSSSTLDFSPSVDYACN